jgi:formylglycine-generating enzyme required for sulfatase activity
MTCPFGTTCCGARCVDTDNSVLNCGGCGAQCSLSNATPQCNTGLCLIACATGFGDCDGDRSNGCETGLNTNRAHCGSCGNECPPENHARVFCFNRACQMGTCDPGWADCNGDIRDGCETHTDTDVNQCGACNRRCSAPTGRSPLCAAGVCGATVACSPSNLADCDGVAANGCETDLNTALAHCGRCGNACGQANGAATCTAGGCAITCAANFGDCNASNADGCETDLRTSNANCSRCGLACALPDVSTQACAGGACAVVGCANSRLDCDRNPLNGCEVSALTDRVNCGACGARCAAGESCVGGRCLLAQTSCPSATEVGCGVEPINAGVLFTQGDNLALNAGPSLPLTTVGNFAIDRHEVTVARFRRFMIAGRPAVPGGLVLYPNGTTLRWPGPTRDPATGPRFTWTPTPGSMEALPITGIDWNTAQAFCVWDGGRLPTSSEWEFAARGNDLRPFPWGTAPASGRVCPSNRSVPCAVNDPLSASGLSPFRLWHMSGNVWELVADAFAFYSDSRCWGPFTPRTNPLCTATSDIEYRGGSYFDTNESILRLSARDRRPITAVEPNLGFRCARTR